jgi:hypothetical protein
MLALHLPVTKRFHSLTGLAIYAVICVGTYLAFEGLKLTSLKHTQFFFLFGVVMHFGIAMFLGLIIIVPYVLTASLLKKTPSAFVSFALLLLLLPILGGIVTGVYAAIAYHPELTVTDVFLQSLEDPPPATFWISSWLSLASIAFCVAIVAAGSVFIGNTWMGRIRNR